MATACAEASSQARASSSVTLTGPPLLKGTNKVLLWLICFNVGVITGRMVSLLNSLSDGDFVIHGFYLLMCTHVIEYIPCGEETTW